MSGRMALNVKISLNFSFSLMTTFTQTNLSAVDTRLEPPQNSASTSERHIRSYVRRQGKITAGQRKALSTLAPRWLVPFSGAAIDLNAIFVHPNPVILEIGFGMGETTAQVAHATPDRNFLGVEVYDAGVGSLMGRAEVLALTNLKIIQFDAVAVVRDGIAPETLAGIHIFFPDPWPKKRHHKRRLLQTAFVSLLASRLTPGGYLHVATDWPDYAAQILEVLNAEPQLQNLSASGGFCARPESRPFTKFEQRGLRLGNPVSDLMFTRRASYPPIDPS